MTTLPGQVADTQIPTKSPSETKGGPTTGKPIDEKDRAAHFDAALNHGSGLLDKPPIGLHDDNDTPVALREINGKRFTPMDAYSSDNSAPSQQAQSGKWHVPDGKHVVGREGTIVAPGGPIGTFIENNVASGYTFGETHDNLVDKLTSMGLPDALANVPTMIPSYVYGVIRDNNELSPEERPDKFELLNIKF